ncbi:hypothetical protein [Methylobacterium sp. J-088]|uniref:allophanate hydrolase-related protein n=1 Tax=Methylobacterium sp. J-088 TaxID=2836664 RepID=UPI00391DEB6A
MVWAPAPAAFWAFVAAIPEPLAIGNLRLADGTAPKGFLKEAAAVAGAVDLTRWGDWRRCTASRAAP